jgi:hypothetical protein
MEVINRFSNVVKNYCKSLVEKVNTFVDINLNESKKFFTSIYKHKKEELKTNNVFLVLPITVVSFFISILKIVYKKIKHRYDRYNKKRECIYTYHGKTYRIFFKRPKYYSSRIVEAHELTTNKNIVERIKEYAGPLENFHHESVTPNNLGYERIRITTMDGTDINVKEFNKDEVIKI